MSALKEIVSQIGSKSVIDYRISFFFVSLTVIRFCLFASLNVLIIYLLGIRKLHLYKSEDKVQTQPKHRQKGKAMI